MKKGIGVMTGSFNPMQKSHLNLAKEVLRRFSQIEKIVFVPVGDHYQKPELREAAYRYQIVQAVCEKQSNMEVSRIEMDQPRQLYTYETLALLQQEYIDYDLYLIMGGDNLAEFDTWQHYLEILQRYYIIAFSRENNKVAKIVESHEELKKFKNRISLIDSRHILEISSTQVRRYCNKGKSIKDLVPKEVYRVIQQNNLYE